MRSREARDGRRLRMILHGRCHCGNIAFAVDWPGAAADIPARACGCSFCVKHGGVWTSHPASRMTVTVDDAAQVSKYVFGTRTATFHVCARCGAVPLVTSEIASRVYAVFNVNTLEDVDRAALRPTTANFEGESLESRLARRTRNWIGDVRIVEGRA